MTGRNTESRLDIWLAHNVHALDHDLVDLLDIDAGLRDAQLPHRAHSLDTQLYASVDVETGLRAITGPEIVQPIPHEAAASEKALSGGPDPSLVVAIDNASLDARLRLRSVLMYHQQLFNLEQVACALVTLHHMTAEAADLSRWAGERRWAENIEERRLALARDSDLSRPVAYLRKIRIDLEQKMNEFTRRTSAYMPDALREHLFDATAAFANRIDSLAIGSAKIHTDIEQVLATPIRRLSPLAVSNAFVRIDAFFTTLTRFNDEIVDWYIDVEQKLASLGAQIRTAPRARLAEGITRVFLELLEDAIYRRDVDGIRSTCRELAHLLSDFTSADFSKATLDGVELRGVRWSLTNTHWPEGWRELMLEVSVPIDQCPLPDLYEVRNDPRIRNTVY